MSLPLASTSLVAATDEDHRPLLSETNVGVDSEYIHDIEDPVPSSSVRRRSIASEKSRQCSMCARVALITSAGLFILLATFITVAAVVIKPATLSQLSKARRTLVIDRTVVTNFEGDASLSDVYARIILTLNEQQSGTWKRVCNWFDNKVTVNEANYDIYIKEVFIEEKRAAALAETERRKELLRVLGFSEDDDSAEVVVEHINKDGHVYMEIERLDELKKDDPVLAQWTSSNPTTPSHFNRKLRRRHHGHHEEQKTIGDNITIYSKTIDNSNDKVDKSDRHAREEYRKMLAHDLYNNKKNKDSKISHYGLDELVIHDTDDRHRPQINKGNKISRHRLNQLLINDSDNTLNNINSEASPEILKDKNDLEGYTNIGKIYILPFKPTLQKEKGEIGMVNPNVLTAIDSNEYYNNLIRRIVDLGENAPDLHIRIIGKPSLTIWGWFKTWSTKVDLDLYLTPSEIFANVGKYAFSIPDITISPPQDPAIKLMESTTKLRTDNVSDLFYRVLINVTFFNPFPMSIALPHTQLVLPIYYLTNDDVRHYNETHTPLCNPQQLQTIPATTPLATIYFPATSTTGHQLPNIFIMEGPVRLAIDVTVPINKLPDLITAAQSYQTGKTIYMRVGPGVSARVDTLGSHGLVEMARHACAAHAITKPGSSRDGTTFSTTKLTNEQAIAILVDETLIMSWFRGFLARP